MNDETDPTGGPPLDEVSRRDFMVRTAIAGGAISLTGAGMPRVLGAEPTDSPSSETRVTQVRSDEIVGTRGVHEELLADLLDILLKRVTGAESAKAAWQSILRPDDVIALKFNRSGADGLGTTDPMMRALVRSLQHAGFEPNRIVAVEVSPAIRQETRTLEPTRGWGSTRHQFGSGEDQLAAWLDQVTAIINVPFLKNHNIAKMTCALKNLSHALVKHPAQFHDNACSPYVGDILSLPQIHSKLRFHIVNALRVVFEGGPEANENYIWDSGILFGGADPVAVDMVGLQILDKVRLAVGLPAIGAESGPPEYVQAAAERGLGTSKMHKIEINKIKI